MSKWTHATQPPRSAMAAGKLIASLMAGPSPEAMKDRLVQALKLPPSKSVMPLMAAWPPSSSVMLQALQELPPKRVCPSAMQPPLLSLESPRAQRALSTAQPTKKPCWQRFDAAPARHKSWEKAPRAVPSLRLAQRRRRERTFDQSDGGCGRNVIPDFCVPA